MATPVPVTNDQFWAIRKRLKRRPSGKQAIDDLTARTIMEIKGEPTDDMIVRLDPIFQRVKPLLLEMPQPITVLDLGCFTGYFFYWLKKNLPEPPVYVGLDNWPEAPEVAKIFWNDATFIDGDMHALPDLSKAIDDPDFGGRFDLVWTTQNYVKQDLVYPPCQELWKLTKRLCLISVVRMKNAAQSWRVLRRSNTTAPL